MKKYIGRIIRWLRCRGHKWEKYSFEDQQTPLTGCSGVRAYERLDWTKTGYAICSKCGEMRTVGKTAKEPTLWLNRS